MQIECRRLLATTILLLPMVFISTAMGQEENAFQWVVFSDTPPQSAMASDGSKILIAGTGTFEVGEAKQVTGGGTWATFNASGVATGSGNFRTGDTATGYLSPSKSKSVQSVGCGRRDCRRW